MFILVKNIDGEDVIIGTARKETSVNDSLITIYEISDSEFNPDMIYAKIERFDEVI